MPTARRVRRQPARQTGRIPQHGAGRVVALAAGALILAVSARAAPETARAAAAQPTAPPFGTYLSGVVAGALGDADAASGRLLQVLGSDPGDPGLRSQAFIFSTLAGRPDAVRLAPLITSNPLAPLVSGNARALAGDWAGAQASYGGIEKTPLNQLLQPLLLAWAEQGAGHTDLAMTRLVPLTQGNPIAGVYALHAAMIADLAGRNDQAAALYAQALSLYPGSDMVLVEQYGGFLARNGKPAIAQGMVHALVKAVPLLAIAESGLDSSLTTPRLGGATRPACAGLALAYLTMATLIQQQAPRGQEAESFMLRFALDLQPDLTPARLLLADLQSGAHQTQQALGTLRQIRPGDPLAPVAALRIAALDASLGGATDRADAHAILARLATTYPKRPEPLQSLGDLLQDEGHFREAIAAYDHAIALMSPLATDDWPILFARATAYDRDRQWPRAQSDLQQALSLAPEQPFLLNYLGYSWVERNHDLDQARRMIERALDAKPDDGSIRDSLGWAMYRQNDVPGAVRTLERAAEQIPEDPTVNYHLGVAYWSAGRHVEARDQWLWALNLHPDRQQEARLRAALSAAAQQGGDPVGAADALPVSVP
ncbi:tetratricopeptide repeat protein [Lichenicoccus roseus]|uniref:Tetratricopeptide repeat protein n=1 Tax=Lichenicoccus roseus TaxID=2683649 RepID=A0A5R9J802_9PROT|nr:tetratricopeptide repeat protein [Lichenicoccus roseus]TLU73099.1 tetratricopeptide repeat protein [Lichenicoccus roseus]